MMCVALKGKGGSKSGARCRRVRSRKRGSYLQRCGTCTTVLVCLYLEWLASEPPPKVGPSLERRAPRPLLRMRPSTTRSFLDKASLAKVP